MYHLSTGRIVQVLPLGVSEERMSESKRAHGPDN